MTTTDPVSTSPVESVGQTVDAELAVVKARIAVLEADAKTDWSNVKAWLKANWAHFVTWSALAAPLVEKYVVKLL